MTISSDDLIIMSIVAKPGQAFVGYDLLQAISATGMKFGPMNIFHYYASEHETIPLFSLSSMTEPGEFNWDQIGSFTCTGLSLFMNMRTNNSEDIFALMIATAEQLADDLDGQLFYGQSIPWNDDILEQLQNQLRTLNTLHAE